MVDDGRDEFTIIVLAGERGGGWLEAGNHVGESDLDQTLAGLGIGCVLPDALPTREVGCKRRLDHDLVRESASRGKVRAASALGVQAAAGDLENACHAGAPAGRIDELLAKTVAELGPVVAGLSRVGAATAPEERAAPASVDAARVRALTDRLRALLADNDADASETVQELAELARGTRLAPGIRRVESAVAEYDFESALKALESVEV